MNRSYYSWFGKLFGKCGTGYSTSSRYVLIRRIIQALFFIFSILYTPKILSQDGPGGVGSVDGSSYLKLWLRADKNVSYDATKAVTEWADYSGNGNDVSNSAEYPIFTNNVLNSMPVLHFSTNGSGLERDNVTGSDLFSNDVNTIILVKRSNSGMAFFNWQNTTSNKAGLSLSSGAVQFDFPNTGAGSLTGATSVTSSYHLITALTTGVNQYIYVDGDQDATQPNALTLNTAVDSTFYLGTQDGTSTNGWIGYIAEVMVFNDNLNTAEKLIVENHLSAKYDLTFSTAGNDKYAGDDASNNHFDWYVAGIGEEADGNHTLSNSSGVRISERNSSFTTGEYVFIGHDNTANEAVTDDVAAPVEQRWSRHWYLDATKSDGIDMKLSFDFSEGINGGNPGDISGYVLLYRVGTSGNFSVVTVADKGIENTDQVYFDVDNANLSDGFYTLGTQDMTNSPLEGGQTWYTYITNDWDVYTTWTLDPDGSLLINPSELVPGAADTVVILNGRFVNINSDNKQAAKVELCSGGIITIDGSTSGHDFGEIIGGGRIQLEADNFPAGDTSDFITKGTVEYLGGSDITVTDGRAYYNLIINLDNASDDVIFTDSITINNDLTITKGAFQINDNSGTDIITVDVLGDISIQSNGRMTVGTGNTIGSYDIDGNNSTLPSTQGDFHKIFHQLNAYGDFTNHGFVKLTNQIQPDYDDFTTTGGVSVYMKGSADNNMNLYDSSFFYNLIIDKGTDQSYILTVYSSDSNYFRLYGPNSVGRYSSGFVSPFTGDNMEVRKALWIYQGTLKLTGNIFIPSLSEGNDRDTDEGGNGVHGDYPIGSKGALWIAENNVTVYGTANTSGDVPWGANGVNTGSGMQGFMIIGRVKVTAGTLNTRYSSGIIYYPAQAGELIIEGGTVNASQFRTSGDGTGKFTYIQSGGTMIVRGNETEPGEVKNTVALFNMAETESVFQMSGGDIYLYDNTDDFNYDFYINSAEGNHSVTGGKLTIQHNGGQTFDISSTANLWNLDIISANSTGNFKVNLDADLTVTNDLLIDDYTTLDIDNGGNYTLNIGGDLSIGSTPTTNNAVLTASATTTVNFIGSGNSLVNIANTGNAEVFHVYNLTINKSSSLAYVSVRSPGRTVNPPVDVDNLLTVNKGIFDYGPFHVEVNGGLTNAGVMGTDTASGRIELTGGTAAATITTSVSGSPTYGHIELDKNIFGDDAVLVNNARFKLFTMTNGRIDIGTYRLTVDTNFISGSGFGTGKMIETAADHGARGLKLKMDDDYTGGATVIFPIGSDGNYDRAEIDIAGSVGTISGYLTVIGIALPHPSIDQGGGCSYTNYYWRTIAEGFNGVSSGVTYEFFINTGGPGPQKREYYYITDDWYDDGNAPADRLAYSDGALAGFATGEFTGSSNNCFNQVDVYTSVATGNWDTPATWEDQDGNNGVPGIEDVVKIVSPYTVTVSNSNDDASTVYIYNGGTLDVGNITGLSYNRVSGGGTFRISSANLPTGDFEDFLTNDTAIFEYYGTSSYIMPATITGYPNLIISGSNTKTFAGTDIVVRKNLYIDGETAILNANDDVEVYDSVIILNAGVLQFPNSGTCELTVNKSIDLAPDGSTDANTIEVATGGSAGTAHAIILENDIIMNDNAVINLYTSTTKKANLYFQGDENSDITGSTGSIAFNYLYIQKDDLSDTVTINSDFTLTDDTDRALDLSTGTLVLNNSGIDITLTSGDGDFNIPSDGELILRNATARVTGAGTGITLDGKLTLENSSQMLLTDGSNENYIEYTSSGYSGINITDNGVLTVGSQIRRGTVTTSGVLNYIQTGGTVTVGNNDASETSRGMFEVLNAGSNFTFTGGDLIIGRAQSTTSAALYLDPATSNVGTGQTITFGNASTPAGQSMGIYSSIDLPNITIDNTSSTDPEVKLYSLSVTIDTLTIATSTTFDANDLDLTLHGDFLNSGIYVPGTNNTSFTGSVTQNITGATTFYDLTVNISDTVVLGSSTDITLNNDLILSNGVLNDNANTIYVSNDVNNTAVHYSPNASTGGMLFTGSVRQELSGTGTFGRIEINNASGVALNNDITLNTALDLTNGSLVIYDYLLTLGVNIQLSGSYDENTMIETSGAFDNGGVKRNINPGAIASLFFPVGVQGKYTPVDYSISANSSAGSITVIPVNNAHFTATYPTDVLQYYWRVNCSGISGFSAIAEFNYLEEDVSVTSPNLESDYIPARLVNTTWSKFGSEDVDAVNNIIEFDFSSVSDISGDFTCAIDTALPDDVPVFTTVMDGNWDNKNIWLRTGESNPGDNVPENGPDGQVVVINDSVYTNGNLRSAYKTTVNASGTLYIGTTLGHYLGDVDGTGTIILDFGRLPAGEYENFFHCSGGAIEFSGSGDYYITDEGSTYRKLLLSGTGKRILPYNDITVCDTLSITGATLDNSYNDNQITLHGYLERVSGGGFLSGSGSNATVLFDGTSGQEITGSFTGNNAFNNVQINNTSSGVTLNDTINVSSTITLTEGTINTTDDNILYLPNTATISPDGGSDDSYVNGPVLSAIDDEGDFNCPIGKGSRYGQMGILSTNTTGTQTWKTEYFNHNPGDDGYDPTLFNGSIAEVSETEYWKVTGTAGDADIRIRWDASSDVNGLATGDINAIVLAQWNGSLWTEVGSDVAGTDIDGTVATTDTTAPAFSSGQDTVFTLASYVALGPTAVITSDDFELCDNETGYITIELTGDQPWSVDYEIDGGGSTTISGITSSPYLLEVTVGGEYTLTHVEDADDPSGSTSGSCTVTIIAAPIPGLSDDKGATICEGDTVTFTATGGMNYEFVLEGTGTMQNSSSDTYLTYSLTDGDGIYVIVTAANGCSDTSATTYKSVNPLPTPNITGDTIVCDETEVGYSTAATGNTFTWTITNGAVTGGAGTSTVTVLWDDVAAPSNTLAGVVELQEEDGSGCIGTDSQNVTIYRKPDTGPEYHIPDAWAE